MLLDCSMLIFEIRVDDDVEALDMIIEEASWTLTDFLEVCLMMLQDLTNLALR